MSVGRNDPCPCQSGKKFKKCCGDPRQQKERAEAAKRHASILLERKRCEELERAKQQGHGRPIVSTEMAGFRFVAIGNKLIPGKWKTFVDFLFSYLKHTLTEPWRATQATKPAGQQHPILQIFKDVAQQMNAVPRQPGQVVTMQQTGAAALLLHLAYSLYLVQHNQTVQGELLRRLKKHDQFEGALYESLVCGMLIRAGYHLEFEDERDVTRKHCELTATNSQTGKKFSVEAKRRQPGKSHYDVGNQLHAALQKPAHHPRLVFIELNVPAHKDESEIPTIVDRVTGSLESREHKLTIKDDKGASQPAPPAYVVITNLPFSYGPQEPFKIWAAVHGFKIPDMKGKTAFPSIRAAYHARQRHGEIRALLKSIAEHSGIPTTFDGTSPDIAFRSAPPRLRVGDTYAVPRADGSGEVNAVIQSVAAFEDDASTTAFCRTESGENILVKFPLTEGEVQAYKKYPETFFGEHRPKPESNDPVDLFEWFLNSYRLTSKEQLLENMKSAPNIAELRQLEQWELAEIFCEGTVQHIFATNPPGKS